MALYTVATIRSGSAMCEMGLAIRCLVRFFDQTCTFEY